MLCTIVFASVTMTPFLYMDAQEGRHYVQRWKPNYAADQFVSKTNVNAYSRAHIQLGNANCVGLLCNTRDTAYIIHRKDGIDCIAACLWATSDPSLEEFSALREWCDVMDVDQFSGHLMQDEVERNLWMLSFYKM